MWEVEASGTRSAFGRDLIHFLPPQISIDPKCITMSVVDSSLCISNEDEAAIARKFQERREKDPHFFDGLVWRTEAVRLIQEPGKPPALDVEVSRQRYSRHNVLRHRNLPWARHVRPTTINTVQTCTLPNGELAVALAVRGKTSDQRGLALLGSGFIQNDPPDPNETMVKECLEESVYPSGYVFGVQDAEVIGFLAGSNRDLTFIYLLKTGLPSTAIGLGNQEHSNVVFAPVSEIPRILESGTFGGISCPDHTLGGLECLLQRL